MDKFFNECVGRFKDHVIVREIETKAYHFRKNGEHNYSFDFVWTPGTVNISGDCGEITIQHYSALASFESGMHWLARGGYDYLVGKVLNEQRQREYNANGTLRDLLFWANEEAVRAMKAYRDELREYRQTLDDDPDPEGEYKPNWLSVVHLEADSWSSIIKKKYDVPDGFEMWFKMWEQASTEYYRIDEDPNMIFTAKGRRELKDWLEENISDEHCGAEISQSLGLDDYYGSYDEPQRCRWLIAAAKRAASEIINALPESAAA